MTMRYPILVAGLCVLTGGLFADVSVMEEIVCKVNGDIITRTELERDRRNFEADYKKQGLSGTRLQEATAARAKSSLRDRIDQLLLVQKGKELNLNVESDLTKQIAAYQRQSGIADPIKFQEAVREQTGQSYEDWKSDLKNGMLTQRVIRDEVSSKIKIKSEELQAYYEAHKEEFKRDERVFLRTILVSTLNKDAAGIDAAEKKAKDLVARARKGERFPELAQANSDDASTAPSGGSLDPATKGTLLPQIENAVWTQPKNYISDPIKIDAGYLIVKVDEHQRAGLAPFEEVQNEVTDRLFGPRMDPALRAYLTKLRAEAFLEIKPGFEDAGAAPGKDTKWNDPAQLKPETVTKEEVLAQTRRRRLLKYIPVPGTSIAKTGTSSSK